MGYELPLLFSAKVTQWYIVLLTLINVNNYFIPIHIPSEKYTFL